MPSEAGLQTDALSIFDHVNIEMGVDPANIFLVGHSLGTYYIFLLLKEAVSRPFWHET
jgi:acetyl esterase/lipase